MILKLADAEKLTAAQRTKERTATKRRMAELLLEIVQAREEFRYLSRKLGKGSTRTPIDDIMDLL